MSTDYLFNSIDCGNLNVTDPSMSAITNPMTFNNNIASIEGLENSTLTLGDTKITGEDLRDVMILLEAVHELPDDNPLKQLFDTKKMFNKLSK